MGTDPMNLGNQLDGGQAGADAAPVQGACSTCGRALPEPDLEAVAADVDHRLSLEFGQLVARSAWAGKAPDGLLDGLLGWMPSIKSRKAIWDQGQALWAQLMTEALTGPCEYCREPAPDEVGPAATIIQPSTVNPVAQTVDSSSDQRSGLPQESRPFEPEPRPPAPYQAESATVALTPSEAGLRPLPVDAEESATRAIEFSSLPSPLPPLSDASDTVPPAKLPRPSTGADVRDATPMEADSTSAAEDWSAESTGVPEMDPEYEAHTVMIPAMPPQA